VTLDITVEIYERLPFGILRHFKIPTTIYEYGMTNIWMYYKNEEEIDYNPDFILEYGDLCTIEDITKSKSITESIKNHFTKKYTT